MNPENRQKMEKELVANREKAEELLIKFQAPPSPQAAVVPQPAA